ncbi:hypothetical protein [Chitinophaga rhizophila]|uniref:Lipoprotein n=1 Tax=Chitinophaga rhizophila TaxID=2866212 RepID=A0ABS7G5S4_9BACT|nr:hypothetical protein [Chitinophaga rhizophila]MBW8683007.1 hypothetical protein [Chitinophaga rhizophila]
MSRLTTLMASLLLFCFITASAQTTFDSPTPAFTQKDTSYWIYNFRQFRDAVYQHDIAKARVYIDFPILDESNEIWFLAYGANEKALEKLPDEAKPFTEKDFRQYFSRLFPPYFIKTLLKVKTDELLKRSEYETVSLVDSTESTSYIMYVNWDKAENSLVLNLAATGIPGGSEGEDEQTMEFNIIYLFDVTAKGHLKLKAIKMAG